MFSLKVLSELLADPDLRSQVSQLTSAKIKADIRSVQASSELSRELIAASRRPATSRSAETDRVFLRELVAEHLSYYSTIIDLNLAFSQRLLDKLHANIQSGTGDKNQTSAGLSMNVSAPVDSTVRAPFRVENNRDAPLSLEFQATSFVSEDGSRLVVADIEFDPPRIELQKEQEGKVFAIIPVTGDFKVGQNYFATISAVGQEDMQIVVTLNVEKKQSTTRRKTKSSARNNKKKAVAKKQAVKKKASKKKTPRKKAVKKKTAKKPSARKKNLRKKPTTSKRGTVSSSAS